jgi:hypothetical protein
MGNFRGSEPSGVNRRRLTVPQAADALGVTVDAVRGRLRRGTLEAERDEVGTVYVWIEAPEEADSRGPSAAQAERIEDLQEQVAYLREQLEAERQAHAEARRIIAGLVERMPLQLEAPQEAADTSEMVEEAPEGAEAQSAEGAARDELGAERAHRQMAEERVAALEAELEAYGGGRESPQTVEEASDAEPRPASGGSSQGQARPRSWWRTRIGSIIGGCLVLVFVVLVGFVVTTLILR